MPVLSRWHRLIALTQIEEVKLLILGCVAFATSLAAFHEQLDWLELDTTGLLLSATGFLISFSFWTLLVLCARLCQPTRIQVFGNSAQYLHYCFLVTPASEWEHAKVEQAAKFEKMNQIPKHFQIFFGALLMLCVLTTLISVAILTQSIRLLDQG